MEDANEHDRGYIDGVLHCFNEDLISREEALNLLSQMTVDFEIVKRFIIETFDEGVAMALELET